MVKVGTNMSEDAAAAKVSQDNDEEIEDEMG